MRTEIVDLCSDNDGDDDNDDDVGGDDEGDTKAPATRRAGRALGRRRQRRPCAQCGRRVRLRRRQLAPLALTPALKTEFVRFFLPEFWHAHE